MDIMTHNNIFIRFYEKPDARGDVWFIHGYGESGLSYKEAFESGLANSFNLFVPDFPGFGVSPFRPESATVRDSADILIGLIGEISKGRPVFLVGHSLGGIVGTWTAMELSDKVKGYANIEGNLTSDDTFITGLCARYDDVDSFYSFLLGTIIPNIEGDEVFQRYFASLRFAHPRALLTWAKTCVEATGDTKSGEEYSKLECDTLYIWGGKSIPGRSMEFIDSKGLDNIGFEESGHFPMIDNTEACYRSIHDFFLNGAEGGTRTRTR